jgi:16S rRNA (adenine1518-N6/adenine1519-N6)-dimethyltransferase
MQTITTIRALLEERGLRPKQRYGQNFLHDQNQLGKLVHAASLRPNDLVLEVGPGTGTLTEALVDAEAEVICCEVDEQLAAIVEERLGDRITLIVVDCLKRQRQFNADIIEAIDGRPFKLVANLPYNVASPLMTTLLIEHDLCMGQYVTIQKEVADRLLAGPGSKTYGPLGIIVQALAKVTPIGTVPPTCFWPQPKVTSAMVSIVPSPAGRGVGGEGVPELAEVETRRAFARFITDLFTKRRKQLGTILGRDFPFPGGVTPELRPEALTISQLIELWTRHHDQGHTAG